MFLYRSLRWIGGLIVGNVTLFLLVYVLQWIKPAYGLPFATTTSTMRMAVYFALGGMFGGYFALVIGGRVSTLESALIALPLPAFLLWASQQISEHVPVKDAAIFAI